MDDIPLARALHVLALVHWIGGVAFVTLIVLPLARLRPTAEEGLAFFNTVELLVVKLKPASASCTMTTVLLKPVSSAPPPGLKIRTLTVARG